MVLRIAYTFEAIADILTHDLGTLARLVVSLHMVEQGLLQCGILLHDIPQKHSLVENGQVHLDIAFTIEHWQEIVAPDTSRHSFE